MKKEEIRKEFFKLKVRPHSYNQCRKILMATYGHKTSLRTLYRWNKKLKENNWDLRDKSKRPKTIHKKITPEIEKKVLEIRSKTGWGERRIADITHIGHTITGARKTPIANEDNIVYPKKIYGDYDR